MSKYYVTIHHGPVQSSFNLESVHKPQYVYGIRDALRKRGYRVDLKPVGHINYCMLEICGHQVFRCNLKNLAFNSNYWRSVTGIRAMSAVKDSLDKLTRARDFLWTQNLVQNHTFKPDEQIYRDYFISDIPTTEEIADLDTCRKCCGVLTETDEEIQLTRKTTQDMHYEEISKAFEKLEMSGVDEADKMPTAPTSGAVIEKLETVD